MLGGADVDPGCRSNVILKRKASLVRGRPLGWRSGGVLFQIQNKLLKFSTLAAAADKSPAMRMRMYACAGFVRLHRSPRDGGASSFAILTLPGREDLTYGSRGDSPHALWAVRWNR
jgi:hypothetical protein